MNKNHTTHTLYHYRLHNGFAFAVNVSWSRSTHCHLEGGHLLGVDDSLVNRVGLRQIDHFTETGGKMKNHYKAMKDNFTIL